jgi:hypothetical protein
MVLAFGSCRFIDTLCLSFGLYAGKVKGTANLEIVEHQFHTYAPPSGDALMSVRLYPQLFEMAFIYYMISKVGEPYELDGQGTWNEDDGIDCSGLVIEALRYLGYNVSDQYVGDTTNGVDSGLISNVFSRVTPEPDGPRIRCYIEEWTKWVDEPENKRRYCHIGFPVGNGQAYVTSMYRSSYDGVVAITDDQYFDSISEAPATYLFAAGSERKVIERWFSVSGLHSILQ